MKYPERFSLSGYILLFKTVCKPSSVVYGHLSTNNVTVIPQRYLLNRFGETPVWNGLSILRRVGFTLHLVSPQSRCALTTPFHHCPNGLLFSVALSLKSPPPGFLRHPVSKTLGLSSLTGLPCPRDRITNLKVFSLYTFFYVYATDFSFF